MSIALPSLPFKFFNSLYCYYFKFPILWLPFPSAQAVLTLGPLAASRRCSPHTRAIFRLDGGALLAGDEHAGAGAGAGALVRPRIAWVPHAAGRR